MIGTRLIFVLLTLGALLPGGCRRATVDEQSAGARSRVSDSDARVVLTTSVDHTSLGIADRLLVRARLSWERPALVKIIPPDWDQSDWSLIESTSTPVETRGGRLSQDHTYLVEPFLPGEYHIPAFSAVITPEATSSDTVTISTDPIALTVNGVLPDDDTGKLNPVSGTIAPTTTRDGHGLNRAAIFVSIGVALACSIAAVMLLTRSGSDRSPKASIHDRLVRITKQPQSERGEGYSHLCEVYAQLDPRLRHTSEISRLVALCERARFAPAASDTPSPASLARHTLELLGSTGEGAA